VCFDNSAHASTGAQPTISDRVRLDEIARAAGYRSVARVETADALAVEAPTFLAREGPAFLLVRIAVGPPGPPAPRIPHAPEEMTARLRRALGRRRDPPEPGARERLPARPRGARARGHLPSRARVRGPPGIHPYPARRRLRARSGLHLRAHHGLGNGGARDGGDERLSARGRLVVVSNGVYGERIAAMAAAANLPHTTVESAWTDPPDLDAVDRALCAPDVEAVARRASRDDDRSSQPVADVARLARRHGKLVLVDSVSGLAGDALDVADLDVVVGTGGKCIQAFPGLGFVLVRRETMARLATHPRRSLYLSLPVHWEAQERRTVPFTPAVQLAYALDEALAELLEEGVGSRIRRYAAAADLLRRGFARLGLSFVLPPERRSNSITSLWLPAARSYAALHEGLRARGFVIYEGQGRLAPRIFRVANMGHLRSDDFERFLVALGEVLGA
jgi:2-aminoethylphosphonate-pyruvate transaminase